MIELAREMLTEELSVEMMEIYNDYYDRSKGSEGTPGPLDFRWEIFYALQDTGQFRLYTAREDGRLLGINMYVVTEHLHHRGCTVAICDGLSTQLDARGRGIGKMLVEFAIEKLTEEGVYSVSHAARTVYGEKPLFEKLGGFKMVEQIYQRKLNDFTPP